MGAVVCPLPTPPIMRAGPSARPPPPPPLPPHPSSAAKGGIVKRVTSPVPPTSNVPSGPPPLIMRASPSSRPPPTPPPPPASASSTPKESMVKRVTLPMPPPPPTSQIPSGPPPPVMIMDSIMKEFEHLKIQLEELKKATNGFGDKVIGRGGFGKVYQGEVWHSKGRNMVAIKRLNRELGQGDLEFLNEIIMLSRHTHKNLISLFGFCDEGGERILVYEHASNRSLDRHLSSSVVTWTQRLKICLGAARGLAYLHDHKGTQHRVLHRDIKSANILLDDNWNAKLSDMGLSKIGPANQQHMFLFTNCVGTPGYCDPQYMSTYTLTKESDIYSFGVVLFEVLCGRLCFNHTEGDGLEILVSMWKETYIHNKLDRIIFKDLTPDMVPASLKIFSDIAFECLHYSRKLRPTASLLVKKLEAALIVQESHNMHKMVT